MRNKSLHSSLFNESQLFFICNCNYGNLAVVKKINLCDKTSPYFFFPKTWFHARFLLSPLAHSVLLSFPGPALFELPFRFELHVHVQRLSSSAVAKKTFNASQPLDVVD